MAKAKETKTQAIRTLLARPEGASLAAICAATGWQPHSARAALSNLRKAGCPIERLPAGDRAGEAGQDKADDKSGGAVWRLTGTPRAGA